ncbi:response regulator transcription factor [Bacillus massilinigeriensis]|uniref:response regulator transcription factor n=1 Tax=Bacillus mediterraneensis TaxID=1805474 RepID=UPI0008F8119B|nr:response regulator [Bacillus mediterraneensis]
MSKILLAEDEEILRMLITDVLEEEEYDIDVAEDGQKAISLIECNKYDLIILDYMMPGLTGVEVAEKTRYEGINKDAAIVMLSAKSKELEKNIAFRSRADYFIAKPFSPLHLLEVVKGILEDAQ